MPNLLAGINTDFSTIVDGLETATLKLRNLRGGLRKDLTLQHVRCRPLFRKEMEASGGKVRQGDRIFYWPVAESREPSLGSRLIFEGETWTILAVENRELIDVYQVIARNLAIEAGLDCKATILNAASYSKAPAGDARPRRWTVVAKDVPARFQPITEEAAMLISAEWTRQTYRVIFGIDVPLESDDLSETGQLTDGRYRLVDSAGNRYRVTHYTNQERIDTLPVAIAVRINEGAEYVGRVARRGAKQ